GHYVFNVWEPMAKNPFARIADKVAAEFFPEDPPGFYKVPFHYGDPQMVAKDLEAAGWASVSHETAGLTKIIEQPEAFAAALVYGNPMIEEIRTRGSISPDAVAEAILKALHDSFGPPPLKMPLSAITFTCKAG
ncbi:MAG: methyltransferase type 11, partial [Leisingera sp.]